MRRKDGEGQTRQVQYTLAQILGDRKPLRRLREVAPVEERGPTTDT